MDTPMRRPPPRQYKSLLDDDDGSIWTTSRCQRLLRSLTSRIATIRKKHEHYFERERATIAQAAKPDALSSCDIRSPPSLKRNGSRDVGDDPDWAPGPPFKRPRHTYSTRGAGGRGRGRTVRNGATGQVGSVRHDSITTTPRIPMSRLLTVLRTPPASAQRSKVHISDPAIAKKRQRVNTVSRSHADILRGSEHIWDGIEGSLSSIISATESLSDIRPRERRGTRSLFTTCLSKVPSYIVEAQSSTVGSSQGELGDVTEMVYSDLETLSQNSRAGYRPLREIVRGHSVTILADATRDLLVPFHIAAQWAFLCARRDFVEGGVQILEALMEVQIEHSDDFDSSESNFNALIIDLKEFGLLFDRGHLLWRFIKRALQSGRQGLTWLMDKQRQELWGLCIDGLLQRPRPETKQSIVSAINAVFSSAITGNHSETDILTHQLRVKSNQRRSSRLTKPMVLDRSRSKDNLPKLTSTPYMFLSVVEALAVVSILRPLPDNPALALQESLFQHMSLAQEVTAVERATQFQECIRSMLDLSRIVIGAFVETKSVHLPVICSPTATLDPTESRTQWLNILARFVTTIAEDYGVARRLDAKSCFEIVGNHLLDLSRQRESDVYAQIAVTAAFEFAERQPSRTNLDMALEMEEEAEALASHITDASASHSLAVANVHSPRPLAANFRWEESISEWVARTPQATVRSELPLPNGRVEEVRTHNKLRRSPRNSALRPAPRNVDMQPPEDEIDGPDDESQPINDWSKCGSESGSESESESVSSTSTPCTASLSHARLLPLAGIGISQTSLSIPRQLCVQIMVPPVPKALRHSISEPKLEPAPVTVQRRTRSSTRSRVSLSLRESTRMTHLRTSRRTSQKRQYIDAESDSDDELGF